MRLINCVVLGSILALAAAPLCAGETITNPELGFRLSVPDGFVQAPGKVEGKVVVAFQRLPAANEKFPTFIVVSRLGGVIGREKIDPKEFAGPNSQVTIMDEKWKSFDIEVFGVPEQLNNLNVVTFNAQVPLKPEAIQIGVMGEAGKENELRKVLRSILANLDGETNWLTNRQRAKGITEGIMSITITIAVVVVVWRAVRKRKSSPGADEAGATAEPK